MRTLLIAALAFGAGYFYFSRQQQPQPAQAPADPSPPAEIVQAPVAADTPPSGPSVRLKGHVVRHLPGGGLLITCESTPVVASGLARIGGGGNVGSADEGDVFGTMRLKGHPSENQLADGDPIDTTARQAGVFQYPEYDKIATVKSFAITSPTASTSSTAPAKPGSWMWDEQHRSKPQQ